MKLIELITICQNESGKKTKEEAIIRFLSETTDFNEMFFLRCLLDPDMMFNFSTMMIEKSSMVHAEVPNNISVVEFLSQLSTGELSGNRAIEIFNGLQIDEEEQKILDIILRQTPIGFSLNTVNKIYQKLFGKPFIEKFECQLANKWSPEKKYDTPYWFITPKLDGLRAVFHADKGKLLTRSNKTFVGFEHIERDLQKFCDKYNIKYVDGEIYKHGVPFQTVQSIAINKDEHDERKMMLNYNVFALVGKNDEIKSSLDFNSFFIMDPIKQLEVWGHYITPLHPEIVKNDEKSISEKCMEYVSQGYEGAMLRHPVNFYHYGRSNDLLKVKFFAEDEFEVIDVFEGEGKYSGMLGGIYVKNFKNLVALNSYKDGNFPHGSIISKCGSGFTDEERKNYGSELIGRIVTIKYQGLTDEQNSLRFPTFIGVKLDR